MIISQRFFRKDPGSDQMIPVDFIVGELESYQYEGNTKWRLRMQLEGILPEESQITKHQSSLQALIAGFEKTRVFFADFTKAKGELYPCRFDNPDVPWTEDGPIAMKYFLRPL